MSHMNESCLIWMSHVSYEWVMSHMNESCLLWISHVSHEWVMSHINESCLMWMSHVTYEWVTKCIHRLLRVWMCGHTATQCNTLQHTATCNTLQHTTSYMCTAAAESGYVKTAWIYQTSIPLQHTTTHCKTLPHTATHCNALHHTCVQQQLRVDMWKQPEYS